MKLRILLLALITTAFISCQPTNNDPQPTATNRTVVAYLVGDVNLWDFLILSINKMEAGWNDDIDGKLLVYLDCSPHATQFRAPVLLEICRDTTDQIVSRVVKTYPDQDPVKPEVMRGVLTDAMDLYPAQSYGLIIGGHGNGWLTNNDYQPHQSPSKAISGAQRYDTSIDIDQLAQALPVKYDFIMFHACLMSNIESLYQLRNNCNYIVASIVSLIDRGFPYEIITPYLFAKPHADLYKAADLSNKYYQAHPDYLRNDDGSDGVFTVAVTNTAKLEPLAKATSELLKTISITNLELVQSLIAKNALSYLDLPLSESEKLSLYYDLKTLAVFTDNETARKNFLAALSSAVVINYFTTTSPALTQKYADKVMGTGGVSFYIPIPGLDVFNKPYNSRFEWATASSMGARK